MRPNCLLEAPLRRFGHIFGRAPESALRSLMLCVGMVTLASACTEDAPAQSGPQIKPDAGEDLDSGPEAECEADALEDCTCSGGKEGQKICLETVWSACDCGSEPTRPDVTPEGLRCKAGYYTGTFKGKWRPGAFDLFGSLPLVNADIEAIETAAGPGLAMTLVAKTDGEPGECGEFGCTFEVKNGCITGTATAFGVDTHPFVSTMSGELNCKTGEFKGNMDGVYSLFGLEGIGIPPSNWFFKGDFGKGAPPTALTAYYYADEEKIDDGKWDLREKQSPPESTPGAGGEGTWEATWKSEESPALPKACQDFINGVVPDAGVGGG
jgi:hypothetical protein